jgi:hypothetical protein
VGENCNNNDNDLLWEFADEVKIRKSVWKRMQQPRDGRFPCNNNDNDLLWEFACDVEDHRPSVAESRRKNRITVNAQILKHPRVHCDCEFHVVDLAACCALRQACIPPKPRVGARPLRNSTAANEQVRNVATCGGCKDYGGSLSSLARALKTTCSLFTC